MADNRVAMIFETADGRRMYCSDVEKGDDVWTARAPMLMQVDGPDGPQWMQV